ncbi:extracellular solute-binding protein [Patescibacteria group bacterium]
MKLQGILLGASIVIAIIAVLLLAGSGKDGGGTGISAASFVIWGTIEENTIRPIIQQYKKDISEGSKITYFQKDPATYEDELIIELAKGTGPDIWIMDQELIQKHLDKIYPAPPLLITPREYRSQFTDLASELYIKSNEEKAEEFIIAAPLWLDPLVLFWNKDSFNSASLALAPTTWNEFLEYSEALTQKDERGGIKTSGAALGNANNIPRFKEILSLLLLQQGGDILNEKGSVEFGKEISEGGIRLNPTESVVRFYTDFTNPERGAYSWNASLVEPQQLFAKGSLAMMIDYVSEIDSIKEKGPHLSFDVAKIPQVAGTQNPLTVAKMPAFVVANMSRSKMASWRFILWASESAQVATMLEGKNLAPARRDLLNNPSEKIINEMLRSSALQSSWPKDPDPETTSKILKEMIDAIASRQKTVSEGVSDARLKILNLVSITSPIKNLLFAQVLAQTTAIPDEEGIVPECEGEICDLCDLYKLAHRIIRFLLFNIAFPIAFVMIVFAGVLLLTAGESEERQKQGKRVFANTVIGILLVFFSWIIINTMLSTIGFRIDFMTAVDSSWSEFPTCPETPGSRYDTPGAGTEEVGGGTEEVGEGTEIRPGDALDETTARQMLTDAGIEVNKDPCPAGVRYQDVAGGCTSLEGISQTVIEDIINFKTNSGLDIVVTGGTELGHSGSGLGSHAGGTKLDIGRSTELDSFIADNFVLSGVRGDGAMLYKDLDSGAVFAKEHDHWDIKGWDSCFRDCE